MQLVELFNSDKSSGIHGDETVKRFGTGRENAIEDDEKEDKVGMSVRVWWQSCPT